MTNKTIGNRGEDLAMNVLRARGVHMVERIATPVHLIPSGRKDGTFRVVYGEKVSGDTRGVLSDGRSVLVETKTIMNRNLRWSDLSPHQPGRLTQHAELGGLSLLVWVHHSGVYVMRWPVKGFCKGKGLTPAKAWGLDLIEVK